MIRFFRKLRLNMLNENRVSRYILYALGEILLVVIGILIALQVNNWNSERIAGKDIKERYQRIHEELSHTALLMNERIQFIDTLLIANNTRTLRLLQHGSSDSLAELNNTLSGLPQVIAINFNLPVSEAFINDGHIARIENLEIKTKLLNLKNALSFSRILEEYSTQQLHTIIEPFLMKKVNYAQITRNPGLIEVHPVSDYSALANDLEFENIVNLKLEVDRDKVRYLGTLIELMSSLEEDIYKELQHD